MATALKPASSKPLLTVLHLDLTHIEAGVPLKALTDFSTTSGIPMKDIYDVVIPARTLKHRRERKQSLTRDESSTTPSRSLAKKPKLSPGSTPPSAASTAEPP
jgi:hypothetical protein